MGAISGTLVHGTEFSGNTKLVVISCTIASASDQITLTQATHGISKILAIISALPTAGVDNDFQTIVPTFSGLVITLTSKQADGNAADEFTGTTANITLIGEDDRS